jgi:hypothetical protein
LRMPTEGPRMSLEQFCSAFDLSDSVKAALEQQDVHGPEDLDQLPFELYRKPEEEDGLGLKIGSAVRLRKAMVAWKQGHGSWEEADAADRRSRGVEME